MRKRSTFGNRFGTVAVVGGSVVGLGNIWRFPYVAGENGGAAFIIIYIIISLMISVPIMLTEFSIGRYSRRNSMRSFKKLSDNPLWQGVGFMGIATAFIILSFYSVIAGWSLEFLRESVAGTLTNSSPEQIKNNLDTFIASGWRPALWTVAFVVSSCTIVGLGVTKGIERANKVLMPLMVIILVGLAINSFSLSGFKEGVDFLLRPDFSKITWSVGLEALGQSFFSMSLGMGAMITYGSYIKRSENMFKVAGTVAISDVTVAILSGLAIFPAVFSFGISPTSGPDLVFITLPNVFAQLSGGYIISILFFFLLFAAAITSSVSLVEVIVAFVSEEFRISRLKAVILATVSVTAVALMCSLSQVPDSALTIAGYNLFDVADNLSSIVLLPVGAILIIVFAGWVMDKDIFRNELTSRGHHGTTLYPAVRTMVRYVIPIVIAMLFLSKLGLI